MRAPRVCRGVSLAVDALRRSRIYDRALPLRIGRWPRPDITAIGRRRQFRAGAVRFGRREVIHLRPVAINSFSAKWFAWRSPPIKICTLIAWSRPVAAASLETATVSGNAFSLAASSAQRLRGVPQLLEANQRDLEAAPQFDCRRLRSTGYGCRRSRSSDRGRLEESPHCPVRWGRSSKGARPSGLQVQKRVPLGVIFFIYESRPNVTADAAALCVKSGNAVILQAAKKPPIRAERSQLLATRWPNAICPSTPCNWSLLPIGPRWAFSATRSIYRGHSRGGESLIRRVSKRPGCRLSSTRRKLPRLHRRRADAEMAVRHINQVSADGRLQCRRIAGRACRGRQARAASPGRGVDGGSRDSRRRPGAEPRPARPATEAASPPNIRRHFRLYRHPWTKRSPISIAGSAHRRHRHRRPAGGPHVCGPRR